MGDPTDEVTAEVTGVGTGTGAGTGDASGERKPTVPAPPAHYPGKPAATGQEEALDEKDRKAVGLYLTDSRSLNVPAVESVFFEPILAGHSVTDEQRSIARAYHDDGYVVLENLFEPELIDDLAGRYPWMFDPATVDTLPSHVAELFNLDPARRLDAWWACDEVRQLACHPRILELLFQLYGRRPIPFQTLNFLYGTEQPAHSDAIHFSCIPSGFMCGVWVALEDATLENGTLAYYPGSQKLPEVQLAQLGLWGQAGYTAHGGDYGRYENYVRAVVKTHGLQEKRLEVPKGSALIWSSNLLHGGTAITRPGATRMSQVTHYYFENCTYFAPILSDVALGEYRLKHVHDLSTGQDIPHTINGEPLTIIPGSNGRSRLARAGSSTGWGLDPALLGRLQQMLTELACPVPPTVAPVAGPVVDPAATPSGAELETSPGSVPGVDQHLLPTDDAAPPAETAPDPSSPDDRAELVRLRLYAKSLEVERDHLRARLTQQEPGLRDAPGDPVS